MQAKPLFDLRVEHDFYSDKRCRDFAIAPSQPTAAVMRRLSLTWKQLPDRVRVYAGLDSAGAPIACAAAPVALDFFLRPQGETFALITDLTELSEKPAPLFTNAGKMGDSVALDLVSRTGRAEETLTIAAPGPAETFVLAGRPEADAKAAAFQISATGLKIVNFDPATKRLTVDTPTSLPGARFGVSYPVLPPRPTEVFAEVELALEASLLRPLETGPRAFVVPLKSRSARWCYYLVTDDAVDKASLEIVEATSRGGLSSIAFPGTPVDLSKSPDVSDRIGQDLVQRNPNRSVLRLLSKAPVGCRQSPLQLELRVGDATVLSSLPNPAPADIALLETAPGPARELVFYNVVRLYKN